MSLFSLSFFYFVWVGLALAFILGLWLYFDHIDKDKYERRRLWGIFHCISCGHVYTARDKNKSAPCPKCQHSNINLKF